MAGLWGCVWTDWLGGFCFELPEVIWGQPWTGCWKGPGHWRLQASRNLEITSRPTLGAQSKEPRLWSVAALMALGQCPEPAEPESSSDNLEVTGQRGGREAQDQPFWLPGLGFSSAKWFQHFRCFQGHRATRQGGAHATSVWAVTGVWLRCQPRAGDLAGTCWGSSGC